MYIVSDIRLKSSKESLIDKFGHVIFGKDVMAKDVFNLNEDEIRNEFQESNPSIDEYDPKSEPDVVPLAVLQDFMDETTLLPMIKLSDTDGDGIDCRELSLEESLSTILIITLTKNLRLLQRVIQSMNIFSPIMFRSLAT